MKPNIKFTPGQTVYVIERDECGYPRDVSGYMLLAQVGYVAIVTPFINDMTELEETLEYLVTETEEDYGCNLPVFPSEDCFATLEEAEKMYKSEGYGEDEE